MKLRIYDHTAMNPEALDEHLEMLLRSRSDLNVEGYELDDGFFIQAENTGRRNSTLLIFITKVKDAVAMAVGYGQWMERIDLMCNRLPRIEHSLNDALTTSILTFADALHRQMSQEA